MWYLLCLIPLILFFTVFGDFVFLPGNNFSDIIISHYPNMLFLQESLLSGQGLPLWSPNILSGYPFIANPLSGIHYPPGWLALLFPLPLGFNLVLALHLVLGAFGMYRWMKKEGVSPFVAAFTGLAFGFIPKLIGHFAAGHLSLVYAISWTPWLLLAENRWKAESKWSALWRAPGVVLGLIALADPRWVLYSGVLWFAYFIKNTFTSRFTNKLSGLFALHVISQALLALAISTALLLPLLQFTGLSTRSTLTSGDVLDLSLPFSGLVNLFFPTSGGNVEWISYTGAVTLALVLIGITTKALGKRSRFWLWLASGSVILALGSGIPGMELITGFPGLSLLRIPARWLFIAVICLVIAAGFILDALTHLDPGKRQINLLALIGVDVAMLIFTIGGCLLADRLVTELALATVGMLLVTGAIILFIRKRWSTSTFSLVLLVVLLVNLFGVGWIFIERKPVDEVLTKGGEVASYLKLRPGLFRVYSPSYSLPQQTAAVDRIQLADGVDPLQLTVYWSFMLAATGVPSSGYSVTLPDYATGDPAVDNVAYTPDGNKMGLLNVCYLVAEYDLSADGLALIDQFDSTRIYENTLCYPRTWVEVGNDQYKEADILTYKPNQIIVQAEGPGLLVLSEIMYPGWKATVDGQPVMIDIYQKILRSVWVDEGSHKVAFTFKPVLTFWGIGITCATFFFLLILFILGKIRS